MEHLSQKKKSLIFSALRGFAGGGISFTVKSITSLILMLFSANKSMLFENLDLPNYAIYILSFVSSLLIYGSVAGCLCKYNPGDFDRYFEKENKPDSIFSRAKYYLCSGEFYVEVLCFISVNFIAALIGGCPEIFGMFYTGDGIAPNSRGILPALCIGAIIFPICLFEKCDMLPYFDKLIKLNDTERVRGRIQPIFRIALIFVIYPLISPLLPLFPMVFLTAASISASVITAITLGGSLGFVIGICVAIYLARIVIRLIKRKKLIAKIKDSAARADCLAQDFVNPYISTIFRGKTFRFNIYRGKTVYNVLVISAISKRFPIYFTSDRTGYHDHIVGMKHAHFTIMHHYFSYEPKGDGIPILLICPEPKSVFVTDGDTSKRIYNADKLYDFTAYDKEAFLGAMRRGCLGKYDGQKSYGKAGPENDNKDSN